MLSHQNKGELRPLPFKKDMRASHVDISLCEEAEMWYFLQTGVLTDTCFPKCYSPIEPIDLSCSWRAVLLKVWSTTGF